MKHFSEHSGAARNQRGGPPAPHGQTPHGARRVQHGQHPRSTGSRRKEELNRGSPQPPQPRLPQRSAPGPAPAPPCQQGRVGSGAQPGGSRSTQSTAAALGEPAQASPDPGQPRPLSPPLPPPRLGGLKETGPERAAPSTEAPRGGKGRGLGGAWGGAYRGI